MVSVLSWLRSKRRKDIGRRIGSLIVQVSVAETGCLQERWGVTLDDRSQVALWRDYSILLLAVADRLAFTAFGDSGRTFVLNQATDVVVESFARQRHFGSSDSERRTHFNRLVQSRLFEYVACSGVMSSDSNSLLVRFSSQVAQDYFGDKTESERADILLATGKAVGTCLVALLMVPPFKDMVEPSKADA